MTVPELSMDLVMNLAIGLTRGFVPGLLMSTFFFAGLALGIRAARAVRQPTLLLLASAAIRTAVLLASGLWVARIGVGEALGFGAAFILARSLAVAIAMTGTRRQLPIGNAR